MQEKPESPANWLLAQHQVIRRINSANGYSALGILIRSNSDSLQTSNIVTPEGLKSQRDRSRCLHGLTYIVSGNAEFVDYREQRRPITAGDIVHLHRPDIRPRPPEPKLQQRSDDYLECALYLLGDAAQQLEDLGVFASFAAINRVRHTQDITDAYAMLFRRLLMKSNDGEAIRDALICIHSIHQQLIRTEDEKGDWLKQACTLLRNHHAPTDSIQKVAIEIGMPYRRFREQFSKRLGMSPVRYQIQQRMQSACELLRNYSVAKVAQELGYDSVPPFSRQFRAEIGLSPNQYQLQNTKAQA